MGVRSSTAEWSAETTTLRMCLLSCGSNGRARSTTLTLLPPPLPPPLPLADEAGTLRGPPEADAIE